MPQKLGQHFLKNEQKLRETARALELQADDKVIEIGPGHGELTKYIAERAEVIAIEKDALLASKLKQKFEKLKNVQIVEGNALELLPKLTKPFKIYKITGNIPYYITGKLLRTLSELASKPTLTVLTIQKEVAERLTAKPPRMNLLAAAVQFWVEPEILDFVSKTEFSPRPKVDSATICLHMKAYDAVIAATYYQLIKILFKQPRKTVLNNLSQAFPKGIALAMLQKIDIVPQLRPQNLTIEKILSLSRQLHTGKVDK